MEFTLIGVISGMFVIGTCLLIMCHYSSDPNSRHAFNTSRKNTCARGLNIFVSYIPIFFSVYFYSIVIDLFNVIQYTNVNTRADNWKIAK